MEEIGKGRKQFEIILDKEWQQCKYIFGYDSYEPEDIPSNFYNKIKKFFGLKYKRRDTESKCAVYKLYENGVLEHINRKL